MSNNTELENVTRQDIAQIKDMANNVERSLGLLLQNTSPHVEQPKNAAKEAIRKAEVSYTMDKNSSRPTTQEHVETIGMEREAFDLLENLRSFTLGNMTGFILGGLLFGNYVQRHTTLRAINHIEMAIKNGAFDNLKNYQQEAKMAIEKEVISGLENAAKEYEKQAPKMSKPISIEKVPSMKLGKFYFRGKNDTISDVRMHIRNIPNMGGFHLLSFERITDLTTLVYGIDSQFEQVPFNGNFNEIDLNTIPEYVLYLSEMRKL